MPERIRDLLRLYRIGLEEVSSPHIENIILYGSYARGDFCKDSDIDVMILVNLTDFREFEDKIFDMTYDFNMEYHTDIMPIVQNADHFNRWKHAYMFYKNIDAEGVVI